MSARQRVLAHFLQHILQAAQVVARRIRLIAVALHDSSPSSKCNSALACLRGNSRARLCLWRLKGVAIVCIYPIIIIVRAKIRPDGSGRIYAFFATSALGMQP